MWQNYFLSIGERWWTFWWNKSLSIDKQRPLRFSLHTIHFVLHKEDFEMRTVNIVVYFLPLILHTVQFVQLIVQFKHHNEDIVKHTEKFLHDNIQFVKVGVRALCRDSSLSQNNLMLIAQKKCLDAINAMLRTSAL